MEPRMIKDITLKGQGNPLGTTTWDRKVETGSPLTGDLITDYLPAYLEVQERFLPQKRRKLAQGTIYLKAPPSKEGKSHSPNIFEREVGRVHMDSSSLYEVIYEQCFLKLKPFIQASKVDSQVSLVGFLGEKSRAIREVLLEITIGDTPL
ncbi:hypothetical protein Tco_1239459 [Tanacetum coccineum]